MLDTSQPIALCGKIGKPPFVVLDTMHHTRDFQSSTISINFIFEVNEFLPSSNILPKFISHRLFDIERRFQICTTYNEQHSRNHKTPVFISHNQSYPTCLQATPPFSSQTQSNSLGSTCPILMHLTIAHASSV